MNFRVSLFFWINAKKFHFILILQACMSACRHFKYRNHLKLMQGLIQNWSHSAPCLKNFELISNFCEKGMVPQHYLANLFWSEKTAISKAFTKVRYFILIWKMEMQIFKMFTNVRSFIMLQILKTLIFKSFIKVRFFIMLRKVKTMISKVFTNVRSFTML